MTDVEQIRQDKFVAQIGEALSKTLKEAIKAEETESTPSIDIVSAQIIIFSDHHKGARNRADDFQVAERTYNAALAYYFHMGYTLISLGDVEELWEEQAKPVLDAYDYTLKLEAQFHRKGRYLRFWGNHDDGWSHPDLVRKELDRKYGGLPLKVRESLRIKVMEGTQELGVLFLAHGHQGTADSDRFAFLSKPIVRYVWRPFQRLTGISLNTPAQSWQLREKVSWLAA